MRELALVTVRALHRLDPAHTGTILQAIAYSSHKDKGSDQGSDKGVDKSSDNGSGKDKGFSKKDKDKGFDKEKTAAAAAYSTWARASWLAVVTEPRLVQSLARHR